MLRIWSREHGQSETKTMNVAIIGLVGVLAGAAITTANNYVFAVRKENAEAAERRLSRAVELKTAARLVGNEFLVGQEGARMLVDKKRWAPQETKFSLDAWQKDKGLLARELTFNDWNAVATAAMALDDFRTFHTAPRSSDNASDTMAENGKPIFRDIKAGLEALRPYMIDVPPLKSD